MLPCARPSICVSIDLDQCLGCEGWLARLWDTYLSCHWLFDHFLWQETFRWFTPRL